MGSLLPAMERRRAGIVRALLLPPVLFSLVALLASPARAQEASFTFRPDPGAGEIAADARFEVTLGGGTPLAKIRSVYVALSSDGAFVPVRAALRPGTRAVAVAPEAPLTPGKEYLLAARCMTPSGPLAAEVSYRVARPAPRGPVRLASLHPPRDGRIDEERPIVAARFDGMLLPSRDGRREGALELLAGNEPVPASCREGDGGRALELQPAVPLRVGTEYRVRLAKGLRGIGGEPVPPAEWTFRVRDDVFRLAGSFPDAKRAVIRSCDRVLLAFTAPLDARRDPRDFVKIVDADDLAVPGEFLPQGERALVFVPAVAFRPGDHLVLVSGEYASRAGNPLGRDLVIPFKVPLDDFNRWNTDAAKFNRWTPDSHERDRWAPDAR